jgi:hypothetical protein
VLLAPDAKLSPIVQHFLFFKAVAVQLTRNTGVSQRERVADDVYTVDI